MLEKISAALRGFADFLFGLFSSSAGDTASESKREIGPTREEKLKILKDASDLIQRDQKIRALYEKLSKLPKDGTQKRKFERSEVQTKILRSCQNLNIAAGVISLAEIKSRKNQHEKQHKI